ncbi:hypothetical protein MBEHAL_0449 [Halarchaeum acidiphilum MH1-52-1]|uniref:Uncharacterized protein n=1 Tax=Halarchaeum acidiphilum MH1-52-1 TaxID=1261545 RepID=U3A206_9EURY|nr:hypothetical protein [Halarchaeum acidiphilum]GAD51689.1 hypothetical protein MBEHAL_0449 [Halarchaeum acidiphilum MH1-52-1]
MSSSRAIALLCGLLVLSTGATAFAPTQYGTRTAALSEQSTTGAVTTPGHLPVTAERSGFASPETSVTDSLAMAHATLDQRLTRATLQARLDDASNETERRRIVSNATDVLGERTNALVADASGARERFRRGSLSADEYVSTLVSIDARASSLISLAQFVKNRPPANAVTETRTAQYRSQLLGYTDDLRSGIADTYRGQSNLDLDRVYVEAGPNGSALSSISDGTYTRAATRPSNYDENPGAVPSGGDVIAHVQDLYPWVMNQSTGVSFVPIPIQSTSAKYAYRLTLTYANGSVHSYVDMSTDRVYQETQTLSPDGLAASPDVSATNGSTRVAVSRTYPGGPLRVAVTADGDPTAATITVANHTVGTTGADGRLRALSPSGSFTVRATTSDGTTVRVRTSSVAT